MSNFINDYFGPLSKKYCIYFYYLSVFFFVMYVISLISFTVFIVKHYNKINIAYIVNFVMILINTLLGYFVNRLLHSMCMNSLD
jgi:hypothetical protein